MAKKTTKVCKHCKEEIAANAKRCPHCGGKQKGIFSLVIKIVVVLFILLIILSIFGGSNAKEHEDVLAALEMDTEDFKETCTEVSYDELKRYPDKYEGTAVTLTVEVAQVVSQSDGMMRAYGDDMYEEEYVLYDCREDGENIIEDDVITVYGVYTGLETVERAIGGSDDLPCICIISSKLK